MWWWLVGPAATGRGLIGIVCERCGFVGCDGTCVRRRSLGDWCWDGGETFQEEEEDGDDCCCGAGGGGCWRGMAESFGGSARALPFSCL